MDHDPAQVTVFLIAALATVVLGILVALIRPMVRKLFFFDWPPLYEWQQARRQLRRTDQWRVIWATRRSHPVSCATLADAQLAYVRYRHASAQRSAQRSLRRRGCASPWRRSPWYLLALGPLPLPRRVSSG